MQPLSFQPSPRLHSWVLCNGGPFLVHRRHWRKFLLLAFDWLRFCSLNTFIANDHVAYETAVKEFYANFDLVRDENQIPTDHYGRPKKDRNNQSRVLLGALHRSRCARNHVRRKSPRLGQTCPTWCPNKIWIQCPCNLGEPKPRLPLVQPKGTTISLL